MCLSAHKSSWTQKTKSTRTDQDKGEGGRWAKRKREGHLGPGTLLVHSDFSLKLRALALRSSNHPENLFAPDDSHFLCVLWPLATACHQEFRPLGLCALASGSVEVRSDILGFIPPQETQVAFPRKLVGSFLFSMIRPLSSEPCAFDFEQPCAVKGKQATLCFSSDSCPQNDFPSVLTRSCQSAARHLSPLGQPLPKRLSLCLDALAPECRSALKSART